MVKDLADYHSPISSIFTQPKSKEDWEQYRLTKEQVGFYNENGHLSGIKLLEEWQVDALNKELSEIQNPNHPSNHLFYEFHSNESTNENSVLFHSLGHWRISEGFHDLLWNPAFLMAASQLLGSKSVLFWHDQLFCKPALHGGVVAWHQDYSYWTRTTAMQHLTCWIGLDDSSTENGCLHYIPKSHKWGLLDKPKLAGEMNGLLSSLNNKQKTEFKPIPIELKKGYATFHHPLMVHGSHENHSEKRRRACVLNVFADGTISNTNDELLQGVPIIEKGKRMEGKFFPLLYDTNN
ncbi:ectoine hydroxylase-related dioxygenase (phytanoyl-CoA dioxygenase family) [Saonia flava]|uniref:Ectoine hydroxylase-related dioxygenase (Phytanoyl-CoA dioxygenase family) n=1 Tax=Saonia flava TaxID=523696 RepID=A0A846QYY5_9FLAO|nr:phytanoyl-CoA dioxygenase family protein [Saonia flava]NJB70344.1 ectoine hydroxylase-related dioxygenase (phytanoyl-CoA dioxygenase family) [Saonia flava]